MPTTMILRRFGCHQRDLDLAALVMRTAFVIIGKHLDAIASVATSATL